MADRSDFLDAIDRYFDLDDLQELCFELGIDYYNLKGEAKRAKVLALILHLEHRQQIPAMAKEVVRARSFLEPVFREILDPLPDNKASRVVAAANALHELLGAGGVLDSKSQIDALGNALTKLKVAAARSHLHDAQAARHVAELVATARLTPDDRRKAERLLRELGITPG